MSKKKSISIIIICGVFFFVIGYLFSNCNHKNKNNSSDDNPIKKILENTYEEPNDLAGIWIDRNNIKIFKIIKDNNGKYLVDIGYSYKAELTYKNNQLTGNGNKYTKIKNDGNDKFCGLWQSDLLKDKSGQYKITKENGQYKWKSWSDFDSDWIKLNDESIYLKKKDTIVLYDTYKSSSEFVWDKKEGALKNSDEKYFYKREDKKSKLFQAAFYIKRSEFDKSDSYTEFYAKLEN